jgi:hypothetical protein
MYTTCENFDFVIFSPQFLNPSHKIFLCLLCCKFYQYEIVWLNWLVNAAHFIFAVCKFVGFVGGKIWIISVGISFIQSCNLYLGCLSKVFSWQQDSEHVPSQEPDSEFLTFASTVHHFHEYLVGEKPFDMKDLFSRHLLFQRAAYLCLWWWRQAH